MIAATRHELPPFLFWASVLLFSILFIVLLFYKLKDIANTHQEYFIKGTRLVSSKQLAKLTLKYFPKNKVPFFLGKIAIPASLEDRHFLLVGTTGAGKSMAIRQLLPIIRARNSRAIVVDLGSEFIRDFRQNGDLIFCPEKWSLIIEAPIHHLKTLFFYNQNKLQNLFLKLF